ncbi:hypothetical protein FDECE_3548 [Fusarium decemcellulare]|nr:hypothetical protein FDECE_3548 [Fusarium decemcellulare]
MYVVVRGPSPLSPDIRLAKVVSEFGAGLDEKHRPIFKTWQTHSPPSESDVIRLTEEVNRDGSRLHQGSWKAFGTRLFKLLDQIQILIKPGDILVSGSQNMVASGVWAAVRMSLEIATGYLSYFERVSLLLMRLGHTTVIQRERISLFPNDPELKGFMCEYLIVIVELCKTVIRFEGKRFIAQLTSGMTLEKDFKEFETQLGFWSKVINKKLVYLNEKAQANSSAVICSTISLWSESKKREAKDWRIIVLRQLSPHQDEFESTWRRQRRKGTVEWILDDQRYVDWSSASVSSTLLMYGSIGSGKTVTMANITGKISSTLSSQQGQSTPYGVASFFCQFRNRKTLLPRVIFGSLAHQFLKSLGLSVNHPAIRNYRSDFTTHGTESILNYIKDYFPQDRHYYVILDGLDELDIEDAQEVLQPLADLQDHFRLHVCCSARIESYVRPMVSQVLRKTEFVSMSSPQKDQEIKSYIEGEIRRRTQAQELDEQSLKHIRDALVIGAQGMYLWVVLQIDALFPLYNESVTTFGDLSHFLTRLPAGLFNSFEQALSRIKDQRYGSRIFQLVAAAIRPLMKNELRVALNFQPGVPVWDSRTLARDPEAMIYRCGGGLLEIDEEDDTVHFIHHSALQHLLTDVQTDYPDVKIEENDKDGVEDEEPLANSSPSSFPRATNHDFVKCQQKHRHESYVFSANQADVTMGYTCITALNLDHHNRRISRPKKMAVNERALQTISAAATQDSILSRFMIGVLQRKGNYQNSYEFDVTRIIEDLSRASLNEAQLFFGYAEAHWLTHTSQPCSNPEDEVIFHRLFLKLIRENAPGLRFPWGEDPGDSHTITWAKDNRHLRLLYDLLRHTLGLDLRGIVQLFSTVPDSQLLGLACHGKTLGDALCRFVDLDPLDDIGVNTLLKLGASPNEGHHEKSLKEITPLQLAVRKMLDKSTYNIDVVRRLLEAGADVGGSEFVEPPILLTIKANWAEGYGLLFSHGARMIEDLVASGAIIQNYFKEAWVPVATRPRDARADMSWQLSTFSGEEIGWVGVNSVDIGRPWLLLHDFPSAEASSRADLRVLESLVKTKADLHLMSMNGMTLLGLAVQLCATHLARELLQAGAHPRQRYYAGKNAFSDPQLPLLTAARKGCIEMVLDGYSIELDETVAAPPSPLMTITQAVTKKYQQRMI